MYNICLDFLVSTLHKIRGGSSVLSLLEEVLILLYLKNCDWVLIEFLQMLFTSLLKIFLFLLFNSVNIVNYICLLYTSDAADDIGQV